MGDCNDGLAAVLVVLIVIIDRNLWCKYYVRRSEWSNSHRSTLSTTPGKLWNGLSILARYSWFKTESRTRLQFTFTLLHCIREIARLVKSCTNGKWLVVARQVFELPLFMVKINRFVHPTTVSQRGNKFKSLVSTLRLYLRSGEHILDNRASSMFQLSYVYSSAVLIVYRGKSETSIAYEAYKRHWEKVPKGSGREVHRKVVAQIRQNRSLACYPAAFLTLLRKKFRPGGIVVWLICSEHKHLIPKSYPSYIFTLMSTSIKVDWLRCTLVRNLLADICLRSITIEDIFTQFWIFRSWFTIISTQFHKTMRSSMKVTNRTRRLAFPLQLTFKQLLRKRAPLSVISEIDVVWVNRCAGFRLDWRSLRNYVTKWMNQFYLPFLNESAVQTAHAWAYIALGLVCYILEATDWLSLQWLPLIFTAFGR